MKSKIIILVVLSALIATACKKKYYEVPAQEFTEFQKQWAPYFESQKLLFVNENNNDSIHFQVLSFSVNETYQDFRISQYGRGYDRIYSKNISVELVTSNKLFEEMNFLKLDLHSNTSYLENVDSNDFYLKLVGTLLNQNVSDKYLFEIGANDTLNDISSANRYYLPNNSVNLDTVWMKNGVGLYQFTTRIGDKYTLTE